MNEPVVSALLETTYIDRFIKWIHLAERKIVPHHSPPVPILMVHETKSVTKKNGTETHRKDGEELALFVTAMRYDSKSIILARQVLHTAISEKPVLVCKQAVDLIEVVSYANVSKDHACMTTEGIIAAY